MSKSKSKINFMPGWKTTQGNIKKSFIFCCIILAAHACINYLIFSPQVSVPLQPEAAAAMAGVVGNGLASESLPCEPITGLPQPRSQGDDLEPWIGELIEKLWKVESSKTLNPESGDGGRAVGPMQLHLKPLDDVNKYYGTSFKGDDRKDITKSKQIAAMYISMWFETHKKEIAVRIFNGGPRGWRKSSTDTYYKDFLATENLE